MPALASSPSARLRRLAVALAGAVALLELIALTGIAPAPHRILAPIDADPFVGAVFAAAFLLHVLTRPGLVEIGVTVLLAAPFQLWGLGASTWVDLRSGVGAFGRGLGLASLVVLGVKTALRRGEARREVMETLLGAIVLCLLAVALQGGLDVTVALHPGTYDDAAARIDAALLGSIASAPARALAELPILRDVGRLAEAIVPLGLAFAWARGRRGSASLLESAALAGGAGLVLDHASPIVGPLHLLGAVSANPSVDRHGVPSLHVVWALLVVVACSRPRARGVAAAWALVTILAVWVIGDARALDLVLAPALLSAVAAALARAVPWSRAERRSAFVAGAGLLLAWILLLRNAAAWLEAHRAATWLGAAATVAVPLVLGRRLAAYAEAHPVDETAEEPAGEPPGQVALGRAVAPIFFCSGFAGLVYEVVFGKHLGLVFGNTAQAAATVLATYMGGMALGSWAGGRLGARDALRVYARCEIGIGVWCALSPLLFAGVRAAYVALATGIPLGHPALGAIQLGLGGAVMLPATFLMGVTMPVLTRRFLAEDAGLGRAVGLLYGANTLGAAAGALLAGYALLPAFGVRRSTWIAVGLNFAAALLGLRLAAKSAAAKLSASTRALEERAALPPGARRERVLALGILLGGGAVTLALEVTYTHLLAVVAGNSVYAFSLMLFAFLVGLGLGAALMRRFGGGAGVATVGAVELGLAASILAGVFVWEEIPGYFASFAGSPAVAGFAPRELTRFVACCVAMVPPAVCMGALYPAAIDLAARAHPCGPVVGVGRAAALNTAGNIAGALLASFVLLPRLGSLRALHALAALAALLGLSVLLARGGRRPVVGALAALTAALYAVQPPGFDLDRLTSGANVYFSAASRGHVIEHAESVSGGLTTVTEAREPDGTTVRTLYTNGKFQGDDSPHRQVKAQYGFALSPLLHTDRRDRALVIGFGVGGTAGALRDAGFARTDVAELSGDVLRLAGESFRSVNGDVLSDPSVFAYVTDGRNFLLLQPYDYDLVTLEVSSIWFAGAASLYNRELYALVKRRLRPAGVMQQWVQLHHMARRDLASILASVHAELPFVWVYLIGAQGMIVACAHDCAPRPDAVAALDAAPRLRPAVDLFGGSLGRLRDEELLDPAGVARLLRDYAAEAGVPVSGLVSDDDNMALEYATPRGNALPEGAPFAANVAWLSGYGHRKAAP